VGTPNEGDFMNEGGEIMTTTVTPEVGLAPVQEVQPSLAVSPARAIDTIEATDAELPDATKKLAESKENEPESTEKLEKPGEEVEKIREELEETSEKISKTNAEDHPYTEIDQSVENPTKSLTNKDKKKTRLVVNSKALLKRALALTFQIIIKAITQPEKITYTRDDVRIGDDPASLQQNNLDKLLGHEDTSWDKVKNTINNLNGEFSFNDFLATVLGINDKSVPYMIKEDKEVKKEKGGTKNILKNIKNNRFSFSKKAKLA